jgi:hypothetical protein
MLVAPFGSSIRAQFDPTREAVLPVLFTESLLMTEDPAVGEDGGPPPIPAPVGAMERLMQCGGIDAGHPAVPDPAARRAYEGRGG